MSLIMERFIMGNGQKVDIVRVKELKYGKMEANMLGIGRLIKQMVKED